MHERLSTVAVGMGWVDELGHLDQVKQPMMFKRAVFEQALALLLSKVFFKSQIAHVVIPRAIQ